MFVIVVFAVLKVVSSCNSLTDILRVVVVDKTDCSDVQLKDRR